MQPIEYFKLQAKNLFKDYKTKTPVFDEVVNAYLYEYKPKYFDMDGIVCDFDIDEENFTLMNAQHLIAYMAGFDKWTDMLKASELELELAKLLFDNQHKVSLDDWYFFMDSTEELNNKTFETDEWIAIFEEVFVKSDSQNNSSGHFLLRNKQH